MYDVVILCGGMATRLGELTICSPKSLININEKPFIYHQLKLLEKNNFEHVVLCLYHFGHQIEDYIKSEKFNLHIDFSYDGDWQLGTGGAIKNAKKLLGNEFCVLYGDSYLPTNYKNVFYYYQNTNKSSLMTVYKNKNIGYQNNVFIEDDKIYYNKIYPHKNSQYIDYGLGIFTKKTFEQHPKNIFDLSEIYNYLIDKNDLFILEMEEKFYEVGSFDGIEELKGYLEEQNKNERRNGRHVFC